MAGVETMWKLHALTVINSCCLALQPQLIINPLTYSCMFSHNPVPSAPQNVTGEQLNATAVRLHWDPPESPNGIITGFQVTYYGYRTTFQVQQVYHW